MEPLTGLKIVAILSAIIIQVITLSNTFVPERYDPLVKGVISILFTTVLMFSIYTITTLK